MARNTGKAVNAVYKIETQWNNSEQTRNVLKYILPLQFCREEPVCVGYFLEENSGD
jgi:hypothetical protein